MRSFSLGFMNEVRKSAILRCVKVHESAFSFLIHPRHKHPWKIASLRADEFVFADFFLEDDFRWETKRLLTLLIVTVRNILVIGPNSFHRPS